MKYTQLKIALILTYLITFSLNIDLHLYQELGLSTTATRQQVKKAFKQLSLQYHPDRNPNDPLLKQRYQKIIQAYETIKQQWMDPQQYSDSEPTFIKLEDILHQMDKQNQKKTHYTETEINSKKSFVRWCFDNPQIVLAAFCLSIGLVITCK